MIKEVTGDILLSKADLLAHGISAFDPFDSGLALALRERWPSLVKDYRHDTHSKAIGAGELWAWTGVQQGGGVDLGRRRLFGARRSQGLGATES